jgi:hypothetical protein
MAGRATDVRDRNGYGRHPSRGLADIDAERKVGLRTRQIRRPVGDLRRDVKAITPVDIIDQIKSDPAWIALCLLQCEQRGRQHPWRCRHPKRVGGEGREIAVAEVDGAVFCVRHPVKVERLERPGLAADVAAQRPFRVAIDRDQRNYAGDDSKAGDQNPSGHSDATPCEAEKIYTPSAVPVRLGSKSAGRGPARPSIKRP